MKDLLGGKGEAGGGGGAGEEWGGVAANGSLEGIKEVEKNRDGGRGGEERSEGEREEKEIP